MTDQLDNRNLYDFIPKIGELELDQVPYGWNINLIMADENVTKIFGWALPFEGRLDNTHFVINQRVHGDARFSENDAVPKLYPWWPNARMSEFVLEIDRSDFDLMAEQEVVITPRRRGDEGTGAIKRSFYFSPPDLASEFPDEVVRSRIGSTSVFEFSLTGLTLARQFARVFEQCSGRDWSSNAVIADWGCGSGRVARHMVRGLTEEQSFIGLDIDGPAVAWASEHIGPMFSQSPMDPPLHLDDGQVDVLYAYSVFTHLTLPHVRNWVREMARVIRADGYFIFTILSDTAMLSLMPYADRKIFDHFKSDDGFDSITNPQLESIEVSGDYYRNVWFTKTLIGRELSEFFDIELLEQNFHYYQDVVVCRRR